MDEATLHRGLLYGLLAVAAVVCPYLFLSAAPYGRHGGAAKGPTVDNTLGWILMEAPSALVFGGCVLLGDRPLLGAAGAPLLILFALWEIHYLHRAFVFPFRLRSRHRMPLLVMGSGLLFTSLNGYVNGRWLGHLSPGYGAAWLVDPRFLVGGLLFVAGFAINFHADWVLLHLRKPGETGYTIPEGGLYRFITCPNYFGEIVEWTGFALATWALPGLVFAVWTAANLVPRAFAHHRWYRSKFADYPRERRALVPFAF